MSQKTIIVTGASSGIGRATSVALFASAKFRVVLSGRRIGELEETKRLCLDALKEGKEGDVLVVGGDVSKEESVKELFRKAAETFGRVDAVFNNAGVDAPSKPIEDLEMDSYDLLMRVNVRGAFMVTQEAVRQFKSQEPQGGRIINNGSISAYTPRPNSAPYTMAKHAILGLTKCTQLDGRKYNIACSQIDIGNATTALSKSSTPKVQASGHLLIEPGFDVSEVAEAVVFMASRSLDTNVANMTIMATTMPFVGRG